MKKKVSTTISFASLIHALFLCNLLHAQLSTDSGHKYTYQKGINSTTTFHATRGLSQTNSAETMGIGRLTCNIQGTWYSQQHEFPNAPEKKANIFTGLGALSLGINNFVDIFGCFTGFNTNNYSNANSSGIASMLGGLQAALPFPKTVPLQLAAQFILLAGTSSNQINTNGADGFNYFETRTNYDFIGKAIESFVIGDEHMALKIHFNQGYVNSLEAGKDDLLLLAAALQYIAHDYVCAGIEFNSRTFFNTNDYLRSPLWITPSIHVRTPYAFNWNVGIDVSLSKDREGTTTQALEPYRIFSGIAFTFDLLANQKMSELEKQKRNDQEKEALAMKAAQLERSTDSLATKARQDSIEFAQKSEQARRRTDSLAKVAKEDSIRLAEIQRRLDEEKSKRSDAEKQLLSTGLLILDAVFFESGKTEISINSRPYLTIIGKMLMKYPKLQLEVAGHTDNVGLVQTNLRLSQARSESVKNFLIQVAPDLANKLIARGYGPSQPKSDNRRAEGRKMNRRVELVVLNKDVLKEYNQ